MQGTDGYDREGKIKEAYKKLSKVKGKEEYDWERQGKEV